jgi:hypothetical protein
MGDLIFSPLFELSSNELNEVIQIDEICFGKIDSWEHENFSFPLPNKSDLSFCVRSDNKIVGFIVGSSFNLNGQLTSHINRIAILTEFKMYGIGSQLIHFFLMQSRELNCWGASLEFNQKLGLQKFYSKNLFSQINDENTILSYLKAKNKLDKRGDFLSKTKLFYYLKLTQNP